MKDNTISIRTSSIPVNTTTPQKARVVSEKVKIITLVVTAILLLAAASWAIYTVAFNSQDLSLTHKIIILAAGVGPFLVGLVAALVNDYCKKKVVKGIPKKQPPPIPKKELINLVIAKKTKVDASKNFAQWNLLYSVEKSLVDPNRDPALLIGSFVSSSEATIKKELDVLRTLVSSTDATDREIITHIRNMTKEYFKKYPISFSDPSYKPFFKALYGSEYDSFKKEQVTYFLEQWLRYEITAANFSNYCENDFDMLTKDQIKRIFQRICGGTRLFDINYLCRSYYYPERITRLLADNLFELGVPLASVATPAMLEKFPNVLEQYHGAIKNIDDHNTLLSLDQTTILPYIIRKRLLSTAVKAHLKGYLKSFNVWETSVFSDTYTKLIQPLAQTTIDQQRAHITTALAAWDAKRNELMQSTLNPLVEQETKHSAEVERLTKLQEGNRKAREDARLQLNNQLPTDRAQQQAKEAQYQMDRESLAREVLFHKRNAEELAGLNAERMKLEAELKQKEGKRKPKEADPIFNTMLRAAQNTAEQQTSLTNQIAAVDNSLTVRLETIEEELTALLAKLEHSRKLVQKEKDKFATQNNEMLELDAFIDKYSNAPNINDYVEKRRKLVVAHGNALAKSKSFFQLEDAQQERLMEGIKNLEAEKAELERTLTLVAFGGSKGFNPLLAKNPKKVNIPGQQSVPPPAAGRGNNAANAAGDPSPPRRLMSEPLTAKERQEMEQQQVASYNPAAGLLSTTVHSQDMGTRLASLNLPYQTLLSTEADKKALEAQLSSLDAPSVSFDEVPQSVVDDVQEEEDNGTLELRLRLEGIDERIQQVRGMTRESDFKERHEELLKRGAALEAEAKRIAGRIADNEARLKGMEGAIAQAEPQLAEAQKQLTTCREKIAQIRASFWPPTHTKEIRAELVKKLHHEANEKVIEVVDGDMAQWDQVD